jgi:small subunit ribosomal protein S17
MKKDEKKAKPEKKPAAAKAVATKKIEKPVAKKTVVAKKIVAEKSALGIPGIQMPENQCEDKNCPFHGKLAVRGRVFEGIVKSDKMEKSVTIQFDRLSFVPKYERYEKRRTKIKAHNPPCIDAKSKNHVKIIECRPLSKTKNFVVIACESSKS